MNEYKIEILFFFDVVGATRRTISLLERVRRQIFWRGEGHRHVIDGNIVSAKKW